MLLLLFNLFESAELEAAFGRENNKVMFRLFIQPNTGLICKGLKACLKLTFGAKNESFCAQLRQHNGMKERSRRVNVQWTFK